MSILNKYEPQAIDELFCSQLVETIKRTSYNELPHIILHGPPGTGKTTSAYTIAKYYLGDSFSVGFKEFNASDDRGIEFVRTELKEFAQTSSFVQNKFLLLDESDNMTNDAQMALRRILELTDVRFILTCNNIDKLIAPLQSRCTAFNLAAISKDDLGHLAKKILEHEASNVDLGQAIKYANGDIRRFLHLSQQALMGMPFVPVEKVQLLDLKLEEYNEYVYSEEPYRIIRKLHEEVLTKNNLDALIILADTDYKCALGTYKTVQLQAGFVKLKKLFEQ
jgi:DNA polymerase III delta prime subunit